MRLFTESDDIEFSYDPHSKFGRMLADTVDSGFPDPLEQLIRLEEYLLATYGLTFLEAVRKGIKINH